MAPRSMRRGLGVRAILAGGLLAIFGATIPAGAMEAPAFVASSFDTGWNPSAERVAAQFDKTLKNQGHCSTTQDPPQLIAGCEWTYAEVFKVGETTPVTAAAANASAGIDSKGAIIQGKSIIWVAASSLAVDGTEYYMKVHLLGAADAAPDAYTIWTSETFTVDRGAPARPDVLSPKGLLAREVKVHGPNGAELVSGHVSIADPREMPLTGFTGLAADATGPDRDTTATSGLASIELRFFDVLGMPVHAQRFAVDNVGSDKSTWAVAADEIVTVDAFGNESPALDPGVYVLKVAAIDVAGYVSAPSVPVQFIWTGLPSAEPPQ